MSYAWVSTMPVARTSGVPCGASLLVGALLLFCCGGCSYLETMRGDGFSDTRQPVNGSVRAGADDAKPSNFFTDKRSDEIEKSLGGF